MAKDRITQPPKIDNVWDISDNPQFLKLVRKYQAVDLKGRYLHWHDFRWRIDEEDDKTLAWHATKFNRARLLKPIDLVDKNNSPFNFCIPASLQSKLYQIVKRVGGNVASIGNSKASQNIQNTFLVSSLLMEEAISSAQLEGANTTRRIAKDMLETERAPRSEDEQMIINNFCLMKEAKQRCEEPLSIELILDFHRIATGGTTKNSVVPGELRQDNDVYIADGLENLIVHQPPDCVNLPKRMKNLCNFINTDHVSVESSVFIEPIVKAIILHFMIGYDHPFADGNGRTARALFYWFMLKNGFDYFEYISISKFLKEAPKKYSMSYLYSEIDDNDLTYFIYYQVDIILKAIDNLLEYLQKKSLEYEEVTSILKNSSLNEKLNFVQKDILKKAIKTPGRVFTGLEISVDYDIAPTTARKYLNELVKYKILGNYKDGRTIAYIAPANLHELLKKAK